MSIDVEDVRACVGKRVAAIDQEQREPITSPLGGFVWEDDPPLVITFEDGSKLTIEGHGWHDSGGLDAEVSEPS